MFAGGVDCFSLIMVKHSNPSRVYSIDVNPAAAHSMRENTRLNEAYGVVVPILGDPKKIVEQRLHGIADRVLMPLPEKAFEYLPCALLALKKTGGLVHYYDFKHAKKDASPVEKVRTKLTKRLEGWGVAFDFSFGRVARPTGPNWYQVVLDISVKH
ncbi:hypothetical protein A3K79_02845 [Candidatus Bathyarchaeota archaeon RBG_13_46_16b]|nr:MAG: hypothetical protein A3K79_02845 [Candidatus Bathyarchaeota archaeon RBG_13_46_16b]